MKKGLLSIILPSYKSGERLVKVRTQLDVVMTANNILYELVIIDDGSGDNSFEIACRLEKEFSNVKAFELSRNYTSHYAIFSGFQKISGECITVIADDEQQ